MKNDELNDLVQMWAQAGRPNLSVHEDSHKLQLSTPTIQAAHVDHFAQCAEDLIVDALFVAHYGRSFDFSTFRYLDIGANHAISTSNTWMFYKRGAKGVLVEANPDLIPELVLARPRDAVIHAAAANKRENVQLLIATKHEVSSTNSDFLQRFLDSKGGSAKGWSVDKVIQVPAISTHQLLELPFISEGLHLLNVDTEGSDLNILESIDFSAFRPNFLVVEPSDEIVGASKGSEAICSHMHRAGYILVARTRVNLIFKDGRLNA
ncbi:MAG: FkbM family methyltransferase [Pseudomonadota bacterium]